MTENIIQLALKVQNESDSNEILKTPDAAKITQPGRAYLQVGNNEIYEFICNLLGENNVIKGDRTVLNGKEIDIFVEEKQIAIEFNECKYHTEWYGGKSRQYHLTKTKMCKEKGVGLIHIFEDEYFGKKQNTNSLYLSETNIS